MIRLLNNSKNDYNHFLNLINQFRPTIFDYSQFVSRLQEIETNGSEIWIHSDLSNNIVAIGSLIIEKKFIRNLAILGRIEDIVVDNKVRNQGIGSKIISHLISRAKSKGCYKVRLTCQEKLQPFYQKLGFVSIDTSMSLCFDKK